MARKSTKSSKARAGAAVLALEAGVEIKDVEALRERLLRALGSGTPVRVDVTAVQSIDTAGVQVLLAAESEAAKLGVAFGICGESAALTKAMGVLGLAGRLTAAAAA